MASATVHSEGVERSGSACGAEFLAEVSLDRNDAIHVAELFKIIGDPTRVLMLQALITGGELCVRHLAEAVDMSPSSVSHHLRILRQARLVRFRRVGREVYYRPDDEHVRQLIDVCVDHIRHESA